jgi:hypothetical protein
VTGADDRFSERYETLHDCLRKARGRGAWGALRQREPLVHPGPHNPLFRLAATKRLQHVADARTEQAYLEGEAAFVDLVEVAGGPWRTS